VVNNRELAKTSRPALDVLGLSLVKAEIITPVWRATDPKPEDEMAPGRIDERTKALFADAERRAERVIGQLRMATALSLGAVFAIAVITHAQRDDAVLPVQITVASATILAYLALGALSFRVAVAHRFRPWMPWAYVTGDAGFLLSNVGLNLATSGLGGNYIASLPSLWLAPVVLAFGALQYKPARLLYATALLAGGLAAVAGFAALADTPPAATDRFFDAPPNIMRLAMLIAAGAILVAAAARTRSLQRATKRGEARTSRAIFRQKSPVNWPKAA
jgi:adenylate cyclase